MALNLFTYKKNKFNSFYGVLHVYCTKKNCSTLYTYVIFPRSCIIIILFFFNYIFSIPIAFSNENVPCVAFEIYDSLFSTSFWMAFTKKPFTKLIFQHAYINENITRSDCIHLYGYFFVSIFFLILKLFHYSNIA